MADIGKFTEASWVGDIQRLYTRLKDNDDRLNLLKHIDRTMTYYDLPLAKFLGDALRSFAPLSQADNIYFYVDSGDELLLLCATKKDEVASSIPLVALASILPPEDKEHKIIAEQDMDQLKGFFPKARCLFLLPVWLPEDRKAWPSADHRFGIVVMKDEGYDPLFSPFQEPEVQSFAQSVISQLSIGIRIQLKGWRSLWYESLVSKFFELDLDPYACFKELALRTPGYLPQFGPFAFEVQPEVSIIIQELGKNPERNGHFLTMVTSTADDLTGIRLKINDSVPGLLCEQPELSYILGNPREDPHLKSHYKAYAPGMNTVLAAPIREFANRSPNAIINLESPLHHAFKHLHIEALLYLCIRIQPIVTALYDRILERQLQQESILYAQRSYWNTVGAVLRHNTNGQLTAIRMGIDNASKALERGNIDMAKEVLTEIPNSLTLVLEEIREFSNKIHEYTVYGCYQVQDLISEAIDKIEQVMRRTQRWIEIDYVQDKEFAVYCSPILSQHLYNFFDNAVFWICHRMTEEPQHQGKIEISVQPGPVPPEGQEQELNQTCKILVQDNGTGCPPETLEKLLSRPVVSQRQDGLGMGHSVYAAAGYLQTLGGNIEIKSSEGEGFQVSIYLPIYNEKLHQIKADM